MSARFQQILLEVVNPVGRFCEMCSGGHVEQFCVEEISFL